DVSLSDDSSALAAVRARDRAAFLLHIHEKPLNAGDGWQVDIPLFDDKIAEAFETFNVVAFYSDVNPIQGDVERWEQQYGTNLPGRFSKDHPVQADMRGSHLRFTKGHESLVSGIQNGQVPNDGNTTLRRHALN